MCQTLGFSFCQKKNLKFDTSTNSVFKSLVSTRPYEPTVDEYPRSWCGKDSSYYSHYLKLFIPHTVSVGEIPWSYPPWVQSFSYVGSPSFPVVLDQAGPGENISAFWMDGQATRWHHITAPYVATSYQHQPKFTNYCKYLQIGSLKIVSRNLRNTSLRLHSHQWALQEGSLGMRRRTPAKPQGFVVKTTNLGETSEIMRVRSMESIGANFLDSFDFFLLSLRDT